MIESLLKKIKVDEDSLLLCLGVNDTSFMLSLKKAGISATNKYSKEVSHIFFFVTSKHELDKNIELLVSMLHENTKIYFCFPKGKSGIETDLTRDKGWDKLYENQSLRWINLIAIDEQWSAFALRLKTEKEKQSIVGLMKTSNRRADYFDAEKKVVYPPDFFVDLLNQNKQASDFFHSLSYSHQREYVGYILEAKKVETQINRAEKSIQRLLDKKKNLTIS
jgi:hypothetical protein